MGASGSHKFVYYLTMVTEALMSTPYMEDVIISPLLLLAAQGYLQQKGPVVERVLQAMVSRVLYFKRRTAE